MAIFWVEASKRLDSATRISHSQAPKPHEGPIHVGIDLGTSDVVLMVLLSIVVFLDDESTGGTHIGLVIVGHYKVSFEEAERRKRHSEEYGILTLARRIFERICDIVNIHIKDHKVKNSFFLAGPAAYRICSPF